MKDNAVSILKSFDANEDGIQKIHTVVIRRSNGDYKICKQG